MDEYPKRNDDDDNLDIDIDDYIDLENSKMQEVDRIIVKQQFP